MKIHVLSDLHIEFGDFDPPETDADMVLLAGDTQPLARGIAWARERFGEKPVLYILGNHEFYGAAIPKLIETLRQEASGSHVTVLENDECVLGDIRFLGCTLWTDFRLNGNPRISSFVAHEAMTDYHRIRVSPQYRKLNPADTAARHHSSRRWLEEKLREPFAGKTVVMTHHAPSARSLAPDLRDDPINAAYASDLEDFVAASGIGLWVHGHIHHPCDYQLGDTRVICNPRGYLDDPTAGFQPGFVVEV